MHVSSIHDADRLRNYIINPQITARSTCVECCAALVSAIQSSYQSSVSQLAFDYGERFLSVGKSSLHPRLVWVLGL